MLPGHEMELVLQVFNGAFPIKPKATRCQAQSPCLISARSASGDHILTSEPNASLQRSSELMSAHKQ